MNDLQIYGGQPFEIRREIAKLPTVKKALGTVEMGVLLASAGKPVTDYSAGELVAKIGEALRWIFKDVGYRDANEADFRYLVARIAGILLRYFPTFSLDDFKIAFELSIAGELDEYLPRRSDGKPDRGHYQSFNAEYVCKILNAYRARRSGVLRKAEESIPRTKQEIGDEDKRHLLMETKRACIECFERFKENGRLPEMSPIAEMLCYDTLVQSGLAEPVEVSEDEKREVLQRTLSYYYVHGELGRAKSLQQRGTEDKDIQQEAYFLGRRRALQTAFRRMVENKINIRDYVRESDTD